MYDFITAYAHNENFEFCLTFQPHYMEMMKAKLNEYTLEEALKIADHFDTLTKITKDNYLKPRDEINKDALEVLNKVQYGTIKRRIKKEVV